MTIMNGTMKLFINYYLMDDSEFRGGKTVVQ